MPACGEKVSLWAGRADVPLSLLAQQKGQQGIPGDIEAIPGGPQVRQLDVLPRMGRVG